MLERHTATGSYTTITVRKTTLTLFHRLAKRLNLKVSELAHRLVEAEILAQELNERRKGTR